MNVSPQVVSPISTRFSAARLHGALHLGCSSSRNYLVNRTHSYFEEFGNRHRDQALAPSPRIAAVRQLKFNARALSAAIASACDGCWNEETNVAQDYALRFLPTHLGRAEQRDKLAFILGSLAFLNARVAAGQLDDLLGDYRIAGDPIPSALALWRDFLKKHAQRLKEHPRMLVALVNHEGHPEARKQVAATELRHSWLRTSLEEMPPIPQVQEIGGLHLQIVSKFKFSWGAGGALAPRLGTAFFLQELGKLVLLDLVKMERTTINLAIKSERPLIVNCDPDGRSVVVFYETGKAELYRCAVGPNGWPERMDLLGDFGFYLPETEDPVVVWHNGSYWFQPSAREIGFISLENPRVVAEPLPEGIRGELAALAFQETERFLALRHGPNVILIASDSATLEHRQTDVFSACFCGARKVAVAFTNGSLAIYEIRNTFLLKAETRAGILRGGLGWDGSRLLWLSESGFNAWSPGDASPLRIQDKEELFPLGLCSSPREWISQSGGSMLLRTDHSLATFHLSAGDVASQSRLETILGGPIWRAVRREEKAKWLLERQPGRQILLGKDVMGRLYCCVDGGGRFFATDGAGHGLVFDSRTMQASALRNCPLGINVVVGEESGGCWLTDRDGRIYFTGADGACRLAAEIGLSDVHGPSLENCGDHLVWFGYSSKHFPETGSESARTFVFFRKRMGSVRLLERVAEHFRHPKEGLFLFCRYDHIHQRLVSVWVSASEQGETFTIRVAPLRDYIRWQFNEIAIQNLGRARFEQADLSANGRFLGVLNSAGAFHCVSLSDGQVVAALECSSPFSAVASGRDGAEFWLVEARQQIYRCGLVNGAI